MQGGFSSWRCLSLVVATAVAAGIGAPPVSAEHLRSSGAVYGGVADEQEARSYPCPEARAGGWERTGPVVCFAKQAATWVLVIEDDSGCTYDATGYHGSCVFDIDMGDHVRIWGGRGIPYTYFTVDWGHSPPSDQGGGDGETPPTPGTQTGSAGTASPPDRPAPRASSPEAPPAAPGSPASGPSAPASEKGRLRPGGDGFDRPTSPATAVPHEGTAVAVSGGGAVAATAEAAPLDASPVRSDDTRGLFTGAALLLLAAALLVLTREVLRRQRT